MKPWVAHRLTVFGDTCSIPATSLGVRYWLSSASLITVPIARGTLPARPLRTRECPLTLVGAPQSDKTNKAVTADTPRTAGAGGLMLPEAGAGCPVSLSPRAAPDRAGVARRKYRGQIRRIVQIFLIYGLDRLVR